MIPSVLDSVTAVQSQPPSNASVGEVIIYVIAAGSVAAVLSMVLGLIATVVIILKCCRRSKAPNLHQILIPMLWLSFAFSDLSSDIKMTECDAYESAKPDSLKLEKKREFASYECIAPPEEHIYACIN